MASAGQGDVDREELKRFQHWKDPKLAARGFMRWSEIRNADGGIRAFASEAEHPGPADAKWWYLLGYDDIKEAYLNADPFSSGQWQAAPSEAREMIPVTLDPPRHGKFRRLLQPKFTASEVRAREPAVRAFCRGLVEEIAPRGECEFMKDFAVRFPTAIFATIMGLPLENLSHYVELAHGISQMPPDEDLDGSKVLAIEEQIIAIFTELLDARRYRPRDDLISYLLTCRVDGKPMTQEELLSTCLLLFRGGLDTVTAQLGQIFAHMVRHPDLRRRIGEHPDDVPKIVDEMMRFYSIAISARTITRDAEFAGCPMKAGDRVIMPTAAGNRDPAIFANPDGFDPDRPRKPHLGFGTGIHNCLGIYLAQTEMRIALEEWHRLIPDYRVRPGADVPLLLTDSIMSIATLPLTWEPR